MAALLDRSAACVACPVAEVMGKALATKPHRLPFATLRVNSLRHFDPRLNKYLWRELRIIL